MQERKTKNEESNKKEYVEVMKMVSVGYKKRGHLIEAILIGGIVLFALFLGCSSNKSSKDEAKQGTINSQPAVGIESDGPMNKELQFQNDYLLDGANQTEGGVITEIEKQVLDAYRTGNVYDLVTLGFFAAEDAADSALYAAGNEIGFFNYDLLYQTQDDKPDVFAVRGVKLVDDNHAYVDMKLIWSGRDHSDSCVLDMVCGSKEGKRMWLIDDVIETEYGSVKSRMLECANRDWSQTDEDPEISSSVGVEEGYIESNAMKCVVIDATDLRLRFGPSISSETLKWGDGSNLHPNVGEEFRYLDESDDFFKIDYKGNEVWVSKQFTHIKTQ